MILGCIDIGSNTTRLLVAQAADGGLRELRTDRAFTCIRKSLDSAGRIPLAKIEETAGVVAQQARAARELGATDVVAVATAAIRAAPNREELERCVREQAGVSLRIISGEEEARLSFRGAAGTAPGLAADTIAVVDVGGASTEIAVGAPGESVRWWESLPVGSAVIADRHLRSDPPTTGEVDAGRRQVDAELDGLDTPAVDAAVAVGGTATSLLRVADAALDRIMLERSIAMLCEAPIAELADRLALEPERVRLLPAGILILQALSDRLGPLRVACGGIREGVLLELLEGSRP